MKIYFVSPNGFAPLRIIRGLLHGSHGWTGEDVTQPPFMVYGVAIPDEGVDAMRVVDALTQLGVTVLPSLLDSSPIPAAAATALAQYGVLPTDTTMSCAAKMHAVAGMPILRPHLY